MNKPGRLIVSIDGPTLTPIERDMLQHPMIAGVILFPPNYLEPTDYKDKTQLKELIADITRHGDKTCFVDQEGGYVQRFGRGFKSLPAAQLFGEMYDLNPELAKQMAYDYGAHMAEELMQFGIISFAPVCDLDGGNIVISRLNRAFHAHPAACTELLMAYIDGMNSKGMQATGKHFPGHGHILGDTHTHKVADDRSLSELEAKDLSVFIKLIAANKLAAIMPAHIVYPQVDAQHTAGTSQIWLQK
ncbi:MAG TPA: beta-N-acetylhexosaminidase, partial [Gammaproteobacteria bacterium]|nr:beta-N-acetylhexosaminidase [Gammaproteobacteria bacterium]